MTIDGVFYLCHGSPANDTEYLLRRVDESGVSIRSVKELSEMLKGVKEKVILCGHDHLQADIRLSSGMLIVDPGSVGLPAYSDDKPFLHAMASGSPHARFSVLEKQGREWSVSHQEIEYDWESAAAIAERNGRGDWASWLRTGISSI